MSKKKKRDVAVSENTDTWNYNVFQDEDVNTDRIPDGDMCSCGGYLWRIDDYIICGHCGKKWYPGAILDDDEK